MALQFTAMNAISPRGLTPWIARATSSLPVPDSPCTSTGAMLRATFSTMARTCCIAGDWPMSRRSVAGASGGAGSTDGAVDRWPRQARRFSGRGLAALRRQARGHHRRRDLRCAAQRGCDDGAELAQIDGLGEVVVGAGLERFDRVLRRTIGRDDNGFLAPRGLLELAQQIEPGTVRQPHVGDDGAVGSVFQVEQCLLHRAGGLDVVALAQQRQLVQRAQVGLIVDDEQAEVRRRGIHRMTSVGESAARRIVTRNSLRLAEDSGRTR